MESYIINYCLDCFGFTPKQVFGIVIIYILAPKLFSYLVKLFVFVKKKLSCEFTVETQKCECKSQEYNINFLFKRGTVFKYFKTETSVNPDSFRWLTSFQDIEIQGNPPPEMTITKFCKSYDEMPGAFELSVIIWYKKKYGIIKRKKKFTFTYQT